MFYLQRKQQNNMHAFLVTITVHSKYNFEEQITLTFRNYVMLNVIKRNLDKDLSHI